MLINHLVNRQANHVHKQARIVHAQKGHEPNRRMFLVRMYLAVIR